MTATDATHEDATAADRRRGFTVRAIGEIAIRCADVAAMERFYCGILGLSVFARRPRGDSEIVFLGLGESYGGHTAVIALFPQDAVLEPHDGARHRAGPLHHIALTVPYDEQDRVVRWYEQHGIDHWVTEFGWAGWRGVFTHDPEGNLVELVAASPDGPVH